MEADEAKRTRCGGWLSLVTGRLVLCTLVVSMLTCSLSTYNTSVLNLPLKTIVRRYNETFCTRGACVAADWDFLPLTTAVYVAAGTLGCLVAGSVANRWGRLRAMWVDQPLVVVGGVLSGCSYWVPELMHVGRALLGFGCALSYCVAALYLTEIAPRRIRGVVGCCNQLGVVLGVMVAQLLGLPCLLGSETLWPILVALPALPATLCSVLLRWCPESPRYLYMSRRDEAGARQALQMLRSTAEQVDSDLVEYDAEQAKIGSVKRFGVVQLFTHGEFRMPLSLALVISLTQQLSGISAIFVYSSSIFEKAGVTSEQMPFAVLATGLVNLVVTVLGLMLIERCGRRHLLIWPTCLMAVAMLLLVFSIRFQAEQPWLSYMSIGCIVAYIVGYTPGLGPITSLLPTELFRQEARGAATALAQGTLWGACLLVHLTFKPLMDWIDELVFVAFLLLLIPSIVFFYIYMPETKNKTFDEIQSDLLTRNACLCKPSVAEKAQQQPLVHAVAECDASQRV